MPRCARIISLMAILLSLIQYQLSTWDIIQMLNQGDVKLRNKLIDVPRRKKRKREKQVITVNEFIVDDGEVNQLLVPDPIPELSTAELFIKEIPLKKDVEIQCDLCNCFTSKVPHELNELAPPKMHHKKNQIDFGVAYSRMLDPEIIFYTGLKKEVVDKLMLIFTHQTLISICTKLQMEEQILLVLMKLRLGLLVTDLAYRFCISPSLVCKIFKFWIGKLSAVVGKLVLWLPRETIISTMPLKFKEEQPKTICIIDCTEVNMQRAKRHRTKSQTYSSYKSHNTVKFLVAIAPNGYVMYISPVYGGKSSDKHIVLSSGFLKMLSPGDEVMADRGFKIASELSKVGVTLNIPASTLGKSQLSEEEVTATRRIASSRIHVERLIRRMKTYHILNTVIPIRSINLINQIVLTVAGLVNLKPPLINNA